MNIIPSPTTTVRQVLGEMKPAHLIVGGIVLILTAGIVARLLPGAARWAGLVPKPVHPAQLTWISPFGMKALLPSFSSMMPMATSPAAPTARPVSQEELGRTIVQLTSQAVAQSAGDNLLNITAGSG